MSASAPMALENRIMSFADFITATYTLMYTRRNNFKNVSLNFK